MKRFQKILRIPDGTTIITNDMIKPYKNLQEVYIPSSVKIIGKYAFMRCENLVKVEIEEGLQMIKDSSFRDCINLQEVKLPSTVKIIEDGSFKNCISLNELKFNEGLEVIREESLQGCKNIKELNIPKSVKNMAFDIFNNSNIKKTFHYKTNIRSRIRYIGYDNDGKNVDVIYENGIYHIDNIKRHSNSKFGFVCETENGKVVYPNEKGEYKENNIQELLSKANKFNQLEKLTLSHIYKMDKWNKYDSVPSYVVVEQMPYEEIDLFYKDNNKTNWQTLIKASKYDDENQKSSLFALAHALGVFSENGVESKEATDFILNEILPDYSGRQIHAALGGFDVENTPYNPEYAKFFMKYFNGFNFLHNDKTDLLASSHNNFRVVQKIFPEKKVITRQDSERLTLELVKEALVKTIFENVDERAKELAEKAGQLGYSQEQFNKLQEWYLIGNDIPKEELSIVCEKDNEDEVITYEVLEKNDPLGAVIGTLTNCCQVVGGAGQECVEYGMTQPNSTFIAFRQGERLVAQAWVWYDKNTKQVTLDNIEVPNSVMNDFKRYESMKVGVLDCINRLGVNLVKSMNSNFARQGKSDRVERVTIGLGYNDFKSYLTSNYKKTGKINELTGYSGYSDATKENGQVSVVELNKNNIVIKSNSKLLDKN